MSRLAPSGSVATFRSQRGFLGQRYDTVATAASGPAGGSLAGTYPNPTLSLTGAAAGTYVLPTMTVNTEGRITSIAATPTPATSVSSYNLTTGPRVAGIIPLGTSVEDPTLCTRVGNRVTLTNPAQRVRISLRAQTALGTLGPIQIEVRILAGTAAIWSGQSGAAGQPTSISFYSEPLLAATIVNVEVWASVGSNYDINGVGAGGLLHLLTIEPA